MDTGELAIVRRALLWLLGLSILAAPSTFANAPVPMTGPLLVVHVVLLSMLWLALWRRLLTPGTVTMLAVGVSSVGAVAVTHATAVAVADGSLTPEALGNVLLPSLIAIAGISYIGLRFRHAPFAVAAATAAHVTAMVQAAGAERGTLITSRPVLISLRFTIVATVLFAIVVLIAERRARARDLAAARAERLEQQSELRATQYADAAHELRTPLTVILSALDTLELHRERLDPDARQGLLDTIRVASQRLDDRTRDVAAAGRPPVTTAGPWQRLDIGDVVRATVGELQPLLAPHEIRLDLSPGTTTTAPPDGLGHVLENLVTNAVKYGPADGPVTIAAHPHHDTVRLSVHDCGTSLTATQRRHVFDRGYRTPSAAVDDGGSGIGLDMVRRLVTAWGGAVGCDVDARGTTFWVELPSNPRSADRTAATTAGHTAGH